jgi:hypothetical protein
MGELHLAGTIAPAGLYQLVGTNIKILLEEEGYLPASLDGRVACYEPIRFTWHQQHADKHTPRPSGC